MESNQNVAFTGKPELRQPCMVCGISGWVDGGECATGSVQYLIDKLKAKKFAEIPFDRFHVFQMPGLVSPRPQIRIEEGVLKEHHFHQNLFFYWVNPEADNDLILFLGTEPSLHWGEYAGAILSVAEQFAVPRIYILGGVLDKTPHTREPDVSCSCNSEELKEEMRKYGVHFSSYQGPGSFGTTLLHLCRERQILAASIMSRVTYYPEFNIAIPHNPKAIRALVRRLAGLLSLELDISDLNKEIDELESKLGAMARRNAKFRAYVEELEKDFVEVKYEEPLDLSPDEAVRIAEELLKTKPEE